MRVSAKGLLQLKPFDESLDAKNAPEAGQLFSFLGIGVVLTAIAACAAIALAIQGHRATLWVLAMAGGFSLVTSAAEWHAGLKGRAANQVFIVVLIALVLLLADGYRHVGVG